MTAFLRKAPFVRLIIPYILGLIVGFNFLLTDVHALCIMFITFILAFGFVVSRKISQDMKYQRLFGLVIHLFLIGAGSFMARYQTDRYSDQFIPSENKVNMSFLLTDYPEELRNSYKCIVKVNSCSVNNICTPINHKILLYFQKSETLKQLSAGDVVQADVLVSNINQKYKPTPGFNFARYMLRQGIIYMGYADSMAWKITARGKLFFIQNAAIQIREKLLGLYRKVGFYGRELGVISALTIGYKADLDKEVKQAYTSAGAMHILAVSGMHVGLIYIVLGWALNFLNKVKNGKLLKGIIVILVVWFYTLLAGLSPSVMRASVMITFLTLGQMANRKLNVYNSLAMAAFFLLVINPFDLMDVGFQLSFMAVLGIVTLYPLIYNWVSSYNLVNKIWSLVAVSLAAQVATFPLSLYYFHQFPNYLIIANLIVVPLATIVIYGSIGLILLYKIQVFGVLMSKVLHAGVIFLNGFVFRIEKLPFSVASNIYINVWELIIWYVLIVGLIVYLILKKAGYLMISLVAIISLVWIGIGRILGE